MNVKIFKSTTPFVRAIKFAWNGRPFATENLSRLNRCLAWSPGLRLRFNSIVKHAWRIVDCDLNAVGVSDCTLTYQRELRKMPWIAVAHGGCGARIRLWLGSWTVGRHFPDLVTPSPRFTRSSIPAEDANWQKAASRSQTVWVPPQTINLAGISGFRFLPRHDWSVY